MIPDQLQDHIRDSSGLQSGHTATVGRDATRQTAPRRQSWTLDKRVPIQDRTRLALLDDPPLPISSRTPRSRIRHASAIAARKSGKAIGHRHAGSGSQTIGTQFRFVRRSHDDKPGRVARKATSKCSRHWDSRPSGPGPDRRDLCAKTYRSRGSLRHARLDHIHVCRKLNLHGAEWPHSACRQCCENVTPWAVPNTHIENKRDG